MADPWGTYLLQVRRRDGRQHNMWPGEGHFQNLDEAKAQADKRAAEGRIARILNTYTGVTLYTVGRPPRKKRY